VGGSGEVFEHGQELEDRVSPADGVLSRSGSVSIHAVRCSVHAGPGGRGEEQRPAGTHPSPSQILSELLARPLFPSATQDLDSLVVHVLDALPDRRRQFLSGVMLGEGDEFRRWLRRRWRGRGGGDGRDRIGDGRRGGVVRRVRESSPPTIPINGPAPLRQLNPGSGLVRNRTSQNVPMTEIRAYHPESPRVFPILGQHLGIRVHLARRDRANEERNELQIGPIGIKPCT
jgi:hypothetical protein